MPFELPEGWIILRLDDFCFLKAGQFISAKDINQEYDPHLNPCYGGNGLRGYVKTHTHEGEFSLIGRQGALCGNVNYVSGRFYATEHAIVVQCFASLNSKWLYYILEVMNLNQYSAGAAQPGLNVSLLNQLYISIPPRKEQDRIVERIENAFVFIDIIEINRQNLFQLVNTAKSKILDLAIRGKLVPQDPSDEAASILLERIKSVHPERKKKPSKTSDNSHYPFEIPDSWIWLRFSDFLTLLSGRDLSAKECNEKSNGIPYLIGASNIENNSITINRWTTSPKVISKKNDLLITCKGTVGDIIINNIGQVHIARQFMAVRTNDYIETQYLSYCLHFYIDVIKDLARGIIPGISRENLLSLYIPTPPLKEQIIIIQEVNKVFASLQTILASIEA